MIPAVILAGGKGKRLGFCDKPLIPFRNGVLLDTLLMRLAPQASRVALALRTDQQSYRRFGLPCLRDRQAEAGPLAGIVSALIWADGQGAAQVLTVPGDTPFIPRDLISRLGPAPAYAMSQGRCHPLVALWPTSCLPALEEHLAKGLASDDHRNLSVRSFAQSIDMRPVIFDHERDDPFFNINTIEDVARLANVALA